MGVADECGDSAGGREGAVSGQNTTATAAPSPESTGVCYEGHETGDAAAGTVPRGSAPPSAARSDSSAPPQSAGAAEAAALAAAQPAAPPLLPPPPLPEHTCGRPEPTGDTHAGNERAGPAAHCRGTSTTALPDHAGGQQHPAATAVAPAPAPAPPSPAPAPALAHAPSPSPSPSPLATAALALLEAERYEEDSLTWVAPVRPVRPRQPPRPPSTR
jgi:hypothetical protein